MNRCFSLTLTRSLAPGLAWLTLGIAAAQTAPVTLEQWLAKPPTSMGVQLAQANLESAQGGLNQLQSDPTTLKADLLTAQGNLSYARSNLTYAAAQGRFNLAQAYFNAVAADRKRGLDELRASLAQTEVGVAKERVRVGSGTALAVEQAQAALAQVTQDLKLDEVQRAVQNDILKNLLGVKSLPALDAQVPIGGAVPAIESVRTASLGTPIVVRAEGAVEIARLRLEQAQPEYTSQAQRTAAQQALLSAQLEYQSQVGIAQQAAQQAFVSALNTKALLEAAQASLGAQESALKTAQSQEKAGTVSRLQVRALEVSFKQSEYAALQARQAAYLAWLGLDLAAPFQGVK